MPRPKLAFPETTVFATDIDVRVTDLNYGNHLGNDRALGLMHEARVRFLRHLGFNEADVGGAAILVAAAQIVYKAEAFGGDQLRFELAVGDIGRVDCELFYRARRSADDRIIAEAMTQIVFIDPGSRRVVRVPEAFRKRLNLPKR